MAPFQVKVIGVVAENSRVLDKDADVLPLFSETVNEYVVVCWLSSVSTAVWVDMIVIY